ncbi:MAG: tyrosine-type recombinase/integrase [Terriglobales bacterium]
MPNSSIKWVKYHRNGIPVRESSHSTKDSDAEKLLRRRIGEIEAGTFTGPKLMKISVDELAEDLMAEYRANGRKSLPDVEARWRLHLKPFFGGLRAVLITTQLVDKYKARRRGEGAENATMNRELAALKRMFSIARRSTPPKVVSPPYIAMLKENNVRKGFVEPADYEKLVSHCAKFGLWLRAIIELGYSYGFRIAELLSMKVQQVDLLTGTIRLNPGETKNGKGRTAHMTPAVRELLARCAHGKQPGDSLFTRNGNKPVRNIRGAWQAICIASGLGRTVCPDCSGTIGADCVCEGCSRKWKRRQLKYSGLIFHDLRRSAVREMVRDGISERVAMSISGHRTRSVFDRYDIVSESDIKQAAMKTHQARQRRQAAQAHLAEKQSGHSLGRVSGKMTANAESKLPALAQAVLLN